jgi:hypothetical protein
VSTDDSVAKRALPRETLEVIGIDDAGTTPDAERKVKWRRVPDDLEETLQIA